MHEPTINQMDRQPVDDADIVRIYEPNLDDGDNDFPPFEEGNGDDRPDHITITFGGKAYQSIAREAQRLGIHEAAFIGRAVKLGIISARASRDGNHSFRFETYFHEHDLYDVE